MSAGLFYGGSATSARLALSGLKADSALPVYHNLIDDFPAVPDRVPSSRDVRHLGAPKLDLGVADVLTECSFRVAAVEDSDGDTVFVTGDVATDTDSEFCFGVLAVSPPLGLSTCTSVPSEAGLGVAMGAEVKTVRDPDPEVIDERRRKRRASTRRRRRRGAAAARRRSKRQSAYVLDKFYERDLKDEADFDTAGDLLYTMAAGAADSQVRNSPKRNYSFVESYLCLNILSFEKIICIKFPLQFPILRTILTTSTPTSC